MQEDISQEAQVQPPKVSSEMSNPSSKNFWISLGILILIATVITGAFLFTIKPKAINKISSQTTQNITPSPTPNISNITSSGTTNSKLDEDMQTINADFTALDNDSKSVDQSLNDQPTNLQ